MTKKEFLIDMLDFYTQDVTKRATSGNQCKYKTSDGKKCAIGRHIPDDKYIPEIEGYGVCGSGIISPFGLLPIEIQSLEADFLSKVQTLHDVSSYWGAIGLTEQGRLFIKNIINLNSSEMNESDFSKFLN